MASRSYLLLFPLFLTSLIESRHLMKRQANSQTVEVIIIQLCANPTADRNGNIPEIILVSHPTICNAFIICMFNYIFTPCVICAEGMYFPEGQGNCAVTPSDPQQKFCNGRRMVGHNDSTPMRSDPICSTQLDAKQRPPYYGQTTPFYG